ncbi:hypothetical protein M422DRAFT_46571 [Sphaerobolus stellatus SS14]|uniref:ATP-dependent DNA helicase n=1 Tax=Sphaerobolus stellatus (strain SS14) TaxID=990650 RepID=A0A0C9VES2_SPHS4|nr:hypothetical protein M422DRAFT_46571 [Sphaerobolus stellatus SS14]
MSSDSYFDDADDLSAFIAEVHAIEAKHTQPPKSQFSAIPATSVIAPSWKPTRQPVAGPSKPREIIDVDADDSFENFFDDIDPAELEQIDKATQAALKQNKTGLVAGPSNPRPNGLTRQLTLTGEIFSNPPPKVSRPPAKPPPTRGTQTHLTYGGSKAKKIKQWDHTAFAKSGWKATKPSGKGKGRAGDGDEDCESPVEFEQFPAPVHNLKEPPPFKHKPDMFAAQRWVYPTNKPKRDYQFNIAKAALFENTLVALPTGLGKTFIAGAVMYNYYSWFPEGKVVFVAPTKPLVAQQIDACHKACGIPGDDAAELTGQIPRPTRAKLWMEKHVFFMTPQTLMNDLRTGNCNPTDIVLLVIDEAHKATGDYAYAQVVRYLMATNGHFRILALTATPGAKPEAVQAIIDSLHISHIEIRDENSPDLRKYILPKKISTHVIKMTPEVVKIRDMMIKLMTKTGKRLLENNILTNVDYVKLHSYRCNAVMQRLSQDGSGRKVPWAYPALKNLGALARIMGYLLECSVAMCYEGLKDISSPAGQEDRKATNFRSDPLFQDIIHELNGMHNNGGFPFHPKMAKLEAITLDYFVQANAATEEAGDADLGGKSKVMVFTTFRSSVDEIVTMLNKHSPLIRATRFIGQGTDKAGKKGIAQKEQLEVIQKFKEDVYNVLVATSIGEEGLDIGEVDMIVCYDAQKTPIRMLQRVGRTGRKRAGRVEVLLAESREESNWDKAKDDYESVQLSIMRGDGIQLFGDVDRLLPDSITPTLKEMELPIYEYVRVTKPAKATAAAKGTKRKRNDDYTRNMPQGALDGFITSSKLVAKSKKQRTAPKELNTSDEDEDEPPKDGPSRPVKAKATRKAKVDSTGKKKAAGTSKPRAKKAKPVLHRELTLSQLAKEMEDDSDDLEIERGIQLSPRRRPAQSPRSSTASLSPQLQFSRPVVSPILNRKESNSSPERPLISKAEHAWLLESDDDDDIVILKSDEEDTKMVGSDDDVVILESDEDVKMVENALSSPAPIPQSKEKLFDFTSSPPQPSEFRNSPLSHVPSEQLIQESSASDNPSADQAMDNITPPMMASSSVGPLRRVRRRPIFISPTQATPAQAQMSSPGPSPAVLPRKKRQRIDPEAAKEFLDIEAEVSGDDAFGLDSDVNEVESESDRRFAGNFEPTQAPPRYNQSNVYRHSLMTQAPRGRNAPQFTSRPLRKGIFGPSRPRIGVPVSSSPMSTALPDEYSIDSFVVEDDDDILLREETGSSAI